MSSMMSYVKMSQLVSHIGYQVTKTLQQIHIS